jgi:O-antigen/teichoic acid export membrane protein
VDTEVVKRIFKFSLGNYVAGFIGGLPSMVLPILITNSIGAKFSAYFYMDMMIANFLYIIPMAVSQSLFAEGSHNEINLKEHTKKSIKIIYIILIPAIILILVLGKYILLVFGKNYSNEGVILLQLLTVSVIFSSINYIFGAIFRIKNMIKELIILGFVNSLVMLSLYMMLIKYGLLGIGIAWIITQIIVFLIYLFMIRKQLVNYSLRDFI